MLHARPFSHIPEQLCSKLRVSFVLAALGVIILVACCCALFLRNRIVKCCKSCCSSFRRKKTAKYATWDSKMLNFMLIDICTNVTSRRFRKNLFDVEGGENYYQSSGKSSFRKSKKSKGASRTVDTGVQGSGVTLAKAQEESSKPVGCSPCCRKKKKKSKKGKKWWWYNFFFSFFNVRG